MDASRSKRLWILWSVATAILSVVLFAGIMTTDAGRHPALAQVRAVFVPGKMTSGHHQIELACESCHTPLGGREVLQDACVRCHGASLTEADDKHPLSKFTDPRNAELLSRLDARKCVTCHVEHRPELTRPMGVTLQSDFCWQCHRDIASERTSHAGMKFDTCASSGCHKFHDNRALYEDFLIKHANEKPTAGKMKNSATNFAEIAESLPSYPIKQYPIAQLTMPEADSSRSMLHPDILKSWHASAHARGGVNCTACHRPKQVPDAEWNDKPSRAVCAGCHELQSKSFANGKHGMRIDASLKPMSPADGLLDFKRSAVHRELNCNSCHNEHDADTKFAAVEGCLRCHDDDHSKRYEASKHAELWRRERSGTLEAGRGVSCATCHMPRVDHNHEELEIKQVFVQHNQSETLRPSEKMLRSVCMNCHGLAFAIDSLADRSLVDRNFNGQPSRHIQSIDMALARERAKELERAPTRH